MKKLSILVALVLTTMLGFSQEFLGIKVDGNRQTCINKFLAKGFKVSIPPSKTVTSMKGTVGGQPIELLIVVTPTSQKVWKFTVYLPEQNTWENLKYNYNYYVDLFTKKYGEPTNSYSNFNSPYSEGDGYEITGVVVEKCNYSAYWKDVYIEITKWKQVCINYENEVNGELNTQEKEQLNLNIFR